MREKSPLERSKSRYVYASLYARRQGVSAQRMRLYKPARIGAGFFVSLTGAQSAEGPPKGRPDAAPPNPSVTSFASISRHLPGSLDDWDF